ncbi:MAG: hypothetical protein GF353_23150 [Candidatus Lokiarchaeota archaeon]|nr:hypothetical protein [Candidatus Lokiarchaeota archaeon]
MRAIHFIISINLILFSYSFSLTEKDSMVSVVDSSAIIEFVAPSDTFTFIEPVPILAKLGFKHKIKDTIFVSPPFDSIDKKAPSFIRIDKIDSTNIVCEILESGKFTQGKVSVVIFRNNIPEEKTFFIASKEYGKSLIFLFVGVILILIMLLIFTIGYIRNDNINRRTKEFFKKFLSIHRSQKDFDETTTSLNRDNSLEAINQNIFNLDKSIKQSNKDLLAKFDELKILNDERSALQIQIHEKEIKISQLQERLEETQTQKASFDAEKRQLIKDYNERLNELKEKIDRISAEKQLETEKYEKLVQEHKQLKRQQHEISTNSLAINNIDKNKLERYKEVCKSIIKMNKDISKILLRQRFENINLIYRMNKISLDYFTLSHEEVAKILDSIESILIYQRTDNSWIVDKFTGSSSVEFENFDPVFKEIMFDYCIEGKVDNILIGFQEIYAAQHKIAIAENDNDVYDKLLDQIKNIEKEFTLTLKFGNFEPYSINLFEELTVQKGKYIEAIGGVDINEIFPNFDINENQHDLILKVTQWAYKKDGGVWKNQKALVKISS